MTSPNVLVLKSGEVVFPASGVIVMHDAATGKQRVFTGHDDDVTCLAVHPGGVVVASAAMAEVEQNPRARRLPRRMGVISLP